MGGFVNDSLHTPAVAVTTDWLHHPCSGEAEVVLARATHDDVIEDADADQLEGLHDPVGGVDVLFGWIALLSGVKSCKPEAELHEDTQLRFPVLADKLVRLELNHCHLSLSPQ